jgi:NADH dehydrogenase FAD-containing subunit
MPPSQRRVFVVGGSFAGLCIGRDLKKDFLVTIVDAKEFFEYTPGVLRAYVKPKHLDALTFTLYPVIEYQMGCKFIWGEVMEMKADKTATIKPMFTNATEVIDFDYCIIAAGCNFGPFHKHGESLWFPTIHAKAIPESDWSDIDERFLEGRRRHILREYGNIKALEQKGSQILVVGAGFIGVEWVTELQHFFPKLGLTIIDFLPQCLGPLPANAAGYCNKYMKKHGIKQFYNMKYAANDPEFWKKIELPNKADKEYVCIGVKASNFFMPEEVKSEKGPGGGGWILMDETLAVKTRDHKRWCVDEKGFGRVYAVGDCNYGCIDYRNDSDDPTFGQAKLAEEHKKREAKSKLSRDAKTGSCTVTIDAANFCRFDMVEIKAPGTERGQQFEVLDVSGSGSGMVLTLERKLSENDKFTQGFTVEKKGRSVSSWPIPPIPKISYPGEEEAIVACANIHRIDKLLYHSKTVDCCNTPLAPASMHWPWGAGMFATSLGPDSACFVAGANWQKNSGLMCVWGSPCAVQKEIIEASKTDECANGVIGRMIWHFVHHTPVHLFGGGPRWGY